MNIKPLHDRVVVKRLEVSNKTAGGIIIPNSSAQEKPQEGEVVAVGSGAVLQDGSIQQLTVKVGDTVLFGKWGSVSEVEKDGVTYLIMKESDILATISA